MGRDRCCGGSDRIKLGRLRILVWLWYWHITLQCMNVQIEDETEKSLFCEFSHCRFLSRGKFCLQHLSKVCKSQGSAMCSGNANRLGSCSSARTGWLTTLLLIPVQTDIQLKVAEWWGNRVVLYGIVLSRCKHIFHWRWQLAHLICQERSVGDSTPWLTSYLQYGTKNM